MKHLTEAQLTRLRGRLEDERDRLQRQLRQGVPVQSDDADPGDVQDHARSERERDQWRATNEHARGLLEPVEAALSRMDEGNYGVCLETGEPIPYARLEVQPTARYSVEVQEALEEEADATGSNPLSRLEPY